MIRPTTPNGRCIFLDPVDYYKIQLPTLRMRAISGNVLRVKGMILYWRQRCCALVDQLKIDMPVIDPVNEFEQFNSPLDVSIAHSPRTAITDTTGRERTMPDENAQFRAAILRSIRGWYMHSNTPDMWVLILVAEKMVILER